MDETQAHKEALSAEAVQAATVAAEAKEKARDVQIKKAVEDGIINALSVGVEKGRYVDVSRVPLICQSIVRMHEDLSEMNENIKVIAGRLTPLELAKAKQEGFNKALSIFGAAAWAVTFAFTSWVAFQVMDSAAQIRAIDAKLSTYDIEVLK